MPGLLKFQCHLTLGCFHDKLFFFYYIISLTGSQNRTTFTDSVMLKHPVQREPVPRPIINRKHH